MGVATNDACNIAKIIFQEIMGHLAFKEGG